MSMDKITKEELKNLIGGKALSDDELEMVVGGEGYTCRQMATVELNSCLSQSDIAEKLCYMWYNQFMAECED